MPASRMLMRRLRGVLPLDFDWPISGTSSLDRSTVTVAANMSAYLRKRTADGGMVETRNAGRGEFTMQRKIIDHPQGQNIEWRVRAMKAYPVYDIGGKEFWSA